MVHNIIEGSISSKLNKPTGDGTDSEREIFQIPDIFCKQDMQNYIKTSIPGGYRQKNVIEKQLFDTYRISGK